MSWLKNIGKIFDKETNAKPTNSRVRFTRVAEENRCPVCGNMLSKNLNGTVEIKCKRCKNIITLTKE